MSSDQASILTRIYAENTELSNQAVDKWLSSPDAPPMKQDSSQSQPGLYGVIHSNRNPQDYWSKNIFNNVFPMALAAWMRDKEIECPFVVSRDGIIECELQTPQSLLGVPEDTTPFFEFEASFDAHSKLCQDKSERVDVVVCNSINRNQQYRFLEIKLVVVPDSASAKGKEAEWAPEIVFRPSTSTNCAMTMYRHLLELNKQDEAISMLEPICNKIHSWSNPTEMMHVSSGLLEILRKLVILTEPNQEPVIACTIWKTDGVSPILAENAFDIFAWTSTAFMHMLCDKANSRSRTGISRPLRSALRACRILYELLKSDQVYLERVISDMSFDKQDDKDFSISGKQTIKYMRHKRLRSPAVHRDSLDKIIIGDGIDNLSPERRLDATLYFAYKYATQR